MNTKDLLECNRRGIFPAPNENEKEFLNRIKNLHILPNLEDIPISLENPLNWHEWDWARSTLNKLFDVSFDWVNGYYSNQKLFFWQGAMTWIFQNKTSVIQLRKCLKKKKYLKLYEKDEILAHEAVHAIRMPLNSTKLDEFFAYWTATNIFRKTFGPIIQRPFEANVFMFLIMLLPLAQFFNFKLLIAGLWFAITAMTSFAFFRLFWMRRKIHKSFKKLKQITDNSLKARSILFRLTDEEVFNFSKWPLEKIKDFITKKSSKELRWKIINLAYSLTKRSL